MKKRAGTFAGMSVYEDDSVPENEVKLVHIIPRGPFPPLGEERIEKHSWGFFRFKTVTREELERDYPSS